MNNEERSELLEFTYRPITDKKRAFPLFFLVIGISALLVLLSVMIEEYRGLVSLLGAMGLTVSVYIFTRYVVSDYAYTVTRNSSDELVFTVTKLIGKRITTLYCVNARSIKGIQLFTKQQKKQQKTPKGTLLYNFAPSFDPENFYVMNIKESEGDSEVMLDCTEAVAARLLECAAHAREEYVRRAEEGIGAYGEE